MRSLVVLVIVLAPGAVAGQPEPAPVEPVKPAADKPVVSIGGYIQPQGIYRQDDAAAPFDEDGFRLRRARVIVGAGTRAAGIAFSVTAETELTPEFQLLDGYVTAAAPLPGRIRLIVDAGQVKAPISRQELLSDGNLAFPEKAELSGLAPGRQLGARAAIDVPVGPGWVRLIGGAFNGEGRNQVQNIDENLLYTGRLELGYSGRDRKLAESDLDGETYAVAAGSIGRNKLDSGDGHEKVILAGADVAVGWNGVSAAFEYLQARHYFAMSDLDDYRANGFAVQAGYLLPFTVSGGGRLEVGARLEEIDRNDTVPIVQPGDPNQSLRNYTGVVSYYQRGHALKAQLAFTHVQEVEDVDRTGRPAAYANDTALLQITYRME